MASSIDTSSPHFKGTFPDIYAVERRYPNGGVDGDFVDIEGWAHYWNADRATWCVNAKRDSYWDELITNIVNIVSKIRGATFMGIATTSTIPDKTDEAKMFYIAKEEGEYSNFGKGIRIDAGVSIIYTFGKGWETYSLVKLEQEMGNNPGSIMSQKATTEAINNLAESIVASGFVLAMSSSMGWTWKTYQLRVLNADGSYRAFTRLSLQARYNGLDVTKKLKNIIWQRDTGNKELDLAWNKAHKNAGLILPLTYEDLGGDKYRVGQVYFTCSAEYQAATEAIPATYYVQF